MIGFERGVRPIGVWSTSTTSFSRSTPVSDLKTPDGSAPSLCPSARATARYSTWCTSVDLPDPETPVIATSIPSGISTSSPCRLLASRAAQHQLLAARRAPPRRHRNRNLPGEIAPGQRVGIGLNLRQNSLGQQLAAKLARARPQIEQMIGRAQHIRIVLHHQDRVAQVAQLFQNVNQPRRVARVQPDRRLVQHVERAHQPRAQRSGQLNPLRLAAGERRSQPVQRQVFQAHRIQKAQPLPHLVQNRPGNLLLHRRQLQRVKKLLGLRDGQRRRLADILAVDAHATRLGPQPLPAAIRALRVAAILAQHHPHMQLVLLALHLRKESIDARKAALAAQHRLARRLRQLAPRHVQRNAQLRAPACANR